MQAQDGGKFDRNAVAHIRLFQAVYGLANDWWWWGSEKGVALGDIRAFWEDRYTGGRR